MMKGAVGRNIKCLWKDRIQMGNRSFPKLKIPHQSHADFCSTDTAGGLDNKKRRYAPRGGVAYRLFLWGFPKGATLPFGTRLCEAKCSVLYALSALPLQMPLPPGRARAFEAAGKQGCACVAWSRKRRSVFISRQGVYESPRPSSYAPTCGQSVPKLWPHSRKSSRTAGNRQG